MKAPRHPPDHPDFVLDLEEMLETGLQTLIKQAREAGWPAYAIWPALRSLVANLHIAEQENRKTDMAIAMAKAGLAKGD